MTDEWKWYVEVNNGDGWVKISPFLRPKINGNRSGIIFDYDAYASIGPYSFTDCLSAVRRYKIRTTPSYPIKYQLRVIHTSGVIIPEELLINAEYRSIYH